MMFCWTALAHTSKLPKQRNTYKNESCNRERGEDGIWRVGWHCEEGLGRAALQDNNHSPERHDLYIQNITIADLGESDMKHSSHIHHVIFRPRITAFPAVVYFPVTSIVRVDWQSVTAQPIVGSISSETVPFGWFWSIIIMSALMAVKKRRPWRSICSDGNKR